MKTIVIIFASLIVVPTLAQTTAGQVPTNTSPKIECLTVEEQKELGLILAKRNLAAQNDPMCLIGVGAAGCVADDDQLRMNELDLKLIDCAKQK